jgi:predicted RND superfamily exporter protein
VHRLTQLALRYPKATLLVLGVVTLLLAAGLPRLRTEFGYRVLVGDRHAAIQKLDNLIGRFGGGLPIQIAWECGVGHPCETVFDPASLTMADAVARALAPLEGIREVTSPAHASLLVPATDGFAVRRFVENGEPVADAEALAIRALKDPLWVGDLVSEDGRVGVLLVQPNDTRNETNVRVVDLIDAALAPFEAQGFQYHLVGHAVASVIAGRDLAESTARLIPFTVLAIALILYALSRSAWATACALATMGLALLWTFGILGWLDWPQDGIHEVLAPLILVVGVCDAVHLLARHAAEAAARGGAKTRAEREVALDAAARDVGLPCLVTTLTTAGAFLSFTTSDLATFVRFGLISAFGVMACLVLTFTLLPLLARLSPDSGIGFVRVSQTWSTALDAVVHTSRRRAVPILVVAAGLLVFCAVGWLARLRVDTDFYETFGERSRVMRWTRFMEHRLRASDTLELQVILPPDAPVEDPEVLHAVARLTNFLSGVDGLNDSTSVLDLLERLNRLLHANDPAFERVGATRAANAELLELLALEDPEFLGSWLSFDRSSLRVSVEAPEQSYSRESQVLQTVRDYVRTEIPPDWSVLTSGGLAISVDWVRDVQRTQLRSFPMAFALVFGMVAVFLGSLRLAGAAMVPTLLPVVVTLGTMGWVGMSLDVGRAMIAAILIGIGVDDSVHLLNQYRRERAGGHDRDEAMRRALLHVGRAIVTTSLALALGFLTLMISAWQTISSFGFFVALAILGALAATLFILPALVFSFARGGPSAEPQEAAISPSQSKSHRALIALVAILPVAGMIGAAAITTVGVGTVKELSCWVLPNAHVMIAPGDSVCPLRANDRVREVERADGTSASVEDSSTLNAAVAEAGSNLRVLVSRDTRERWVEVPVLGVTRLGGAVRIASAALLAAVLMCIPLFLLRRSSSPAAVPFAFFYSAISVTGVGMIGGRSSELMMHAALLAAVAIPAILVHLNLTFFRHRKLIRDAPGLAFAPYVLSAMLLPAAWLALDRNPLLWPTFTWLLLALIAAGGAILLVSCAYTIRESTSAMERVRARVLLYGALFLPLIPTVAFKPDTFEPAQLATTYLWMAALVMPLPLGLAISRYNLFNLEWDARRWVGRLVYFSAVALVVTLVLATTLTVVGAPHPLRDPAFLFLISFACAVAVEPLRGRLFGYLESMFTPRVQQLRRLREGYTREISQVRDEDEVARLLGEALQRALDPRAGCVFLSVGAEWRPAYAFGRNAPMGRMLVSDALQVLEDRDLVYLALAPEVDTTPRRRLQAEGIELMAAIGSGEERFGVVLLTGAANGSPYAGGDLDFTAMATYGHLPRRNRVSERAAHG